MKLLLRVLFLTPLVIGVAGATEFSNYEMRISNMQAILDSAEFEKVLAGYEEGRFVFDGLNWVNTPDDKVYYKATFKKFDLLSEGDKKSPTFVSKTTVCIQQVVLNNLIVLSVSDRSCEESISKFKIVDDGTVVPVEN